MIKLASANIAKFGIIFSLSLWALSPAQSSAQVTTTYSYDANGRLLEASRDDGVSHNYLYDDANNLIDATGAFTNNNNTAPNCPNAYDSASGNFSVVDAIQSCTDADGDSLYATAVTDPPGNASTSVSQDGLLIILNNFPAGDTPVTVTIADGEGGSATYVLTINSDGGGGF